MRRARQRTLRRLERGLPGVAARDPTSYDLPDFRTLGDGPYPPILLEAMQRAGDRFEAWEQQVVHTGYCCRPIRLRGKVEQMDRTTGEPAAGRVTLEKFWSQWRPNAPYRASHLATY